MTMVISPSSEQRGVLVEETFEQALETLDADLSGWVILPGDEEYEEARLVRSATINRFPAVIVQVAGAEDVAMAVRFARKYAMTISVRSGGHSFAGHSTNNGGMVIDLRNLQAVSIDPEMRIARAQPGVTSGILAAAAQEYGLALTTGDTSSVALGGLTLGGGIGWMVREHGLTIDSLLSVEMVTADGEIVVANEVENPDLFWALRGGGGNFGIVTEFEFRLQPVGTILAGMIGLPATPEVLRRYADYAISAPNGLTTITTLMQAPPAPFVPEDVVGKLSFIVMVAYTGDLAEGEKAIEPLREIATPQFEFLAPMPYPSIYDFTHEATLRANEVVRSQFMDATSDEVIEASLAAMAVASPQNMIQIRALGGKMAEVPAGETAFAHRKANYILVAVGIWGDGEDGARETAWMKDYFNAIRPHGTGVYVNFLADDAERIREAYPGATYERLVMVKRRFDPDNVFSQNQNIRPEPRFGA